MLVESAALDLRTKRCTRCGWVKRWRDFHAARKWPDGTMRGPQARCRDCQRQYARERDDPAARWARVRADPERLGVTRARARDRWRAVHDVPPGRWRGGRSERHATRGATLEPGPFISWLKTQGHDSGEISLATGLGAREVTRLLHEGARPTLATVDGALVRADMGVRLEDLYPLGQ